MFKTIIFFGVSHNFKAKTISPTADSFVTEEIYDVINLVDHMIRLAVALAGLGMVHPSELFSVRFDSFSLLVAKKRRHSGVLNFGTLEPAWSFPLQIFRQGFSMQIFLVHYMSVQEATGPIWLFFTLVDRNGL